MNNRQQRKRMMDRAHRLHCQGRIDRYEFGALLVGRAWLRVNKLRNLYTETDLTHREEGMFK